MADIVWHLEYGVLTQHASSGKTPDVKWSQDHWVHLPHHVNSFLNKVSKITRLFWLGGHHRLKALICDSYHLHQPHRLAPRPRPRSSLSKSSLPLVFLTDTRDNGVQQQWHSGSPCLDGFLRASSVFFMVKILKPEGFIWWSPGLFYELNPVKPSTS